MVDYILFLVAFVFFGALYTAVSASNHVNTAIYSACLLLCLGVYLFLHRGRAKT